MAEQEDSELTSSHRHTKMMTIGRETVDEKNQKTSRKDMQLMIKRRSHKTSRMVKYGIVKTQNLQWVNFKHNCRGFLQGVVLTPYQTPSQGVWHQEDEPPEYSALDQQALLSEDPDSCENRNSILTGHIQNLRCSRTQGRSNNLKGIWIRTTY